MSVVLKPTGRSRARARAWRFTESVAPITSVRPEVPAAVEVVLQRALARAPEDRFRTGAEAEVCKVDGTISGYFHMSP